MYQATPLRDVVTKAWLQTITSMETLYAKVTKIAPDELITVDLWNSENLYTAWLKGGLRRKQGWKPRSARNWENAADYLLDMDNTVDQILEYDEKEGLLTNAERRRNKPGKIHYFKPEKSTADVPL